VVITCNNQAAPKLPAFFGHQNSVFDRSFSPAKESLGCGTALGKKFIKLIKRGNPKDKCGMGNTFNQVRMRLKQRRAD